LKESEGYHNHQVRGPGRFEDFGGGEDEGELFADENGDLADLGTTAKKATMESRLARSRKLKESFNRNNDVVRLKRELNETKKKQADSNLLAAKLLYTNRILTMEGLTKSQKERVTDAIDEARSLKEAQLLYRNITKSLSMKKSSALSEGRHRSIGASSTVRSGSPKLTESRNSDTSLLNESIDLDIWKKHAGLD
jgi:hypothetical protein